jgi:hypothetical protein
LVRLKRLEKCYAPAVIPSVILQHRGAVLGPPQKVTLLCWEFSKSSAPYVYFRLQVHRSSPLTEGSRYPADLFLDRIILMASLVGYIITASQGKFQCKPVRQCGARVGSLALVCPSHIAEHIPQHLQSDHTIL